MKDRWMWWMWVKTVVVATIAAGGIMSYFGWRWGLVAGLLIVICQFVWIRVISSWQPKRNLGLLSREEQTKLTNLTIGIAGCGLGSQIAIALTRLGVGHFVIADADKVVGHNLNRQAFMANQIGRNKAGALTTLIKGINPTVSIAVWQKFITPENATKFASQADVVIDCIDPTCAGLRASIALAKACQEQGKYYLFPLDVGWGARLYVFPPEGGITLEQFLKVEAKELERKEGFPFEILSRAFAPFPDYATKTFQDLTQGNLEAVPQVISATLTAAVLVVTAVVKIIRQEPLRLAPEFYAFDPQDQGD